MKVEIVPIDSIFPDPRNARIHSQQQVKELAASLKRFGQQKPLVVSSDNIIIAGNGQFQAASQILKWKKIAIARSSLSAQEALAYAIADNQLGLNSEWDVELLSTQVKELKEWNPAQNWDSLGLDSVAVSAQASDSPADVAAEQEKADKLSKLFVDDGSENKAEAKVDFAKPVKLTVEQRETVETAINLLRYYQNEPNMTEGRALELICADWALNDSKQFEDAA